jgi:glycosyltransferase involved in cell wall biosynthesis
MVDAFASLATRLPHAHLLLVGEGPLESEIARRAAAAGLTQRTHFVAHQKDIRPYYEAADVIVSPSHTEGISNVILESLTFGVPVVATRVGGNPEIIEPEQSGVLVEARHPEALADAIVRVANDPALRARLVAEGQRRVHGHFSFEARMTAEQAFYDRVLSGRRLSTKV